MARWSLSGDGQLSTNQDLQLGFLISMFVLELQFVERRAEVLY
jgi:hypothetical protein